MRASFKIFRVLPFALFLLTVVLFQNCAKLESTNTADEFVVSEMHATESFSTAGEFLSRELSSTPTESQQENQTLVQTVPVSSTSSAVFRWTPAGLGACTAPAAVWQNSAWSACSASCGPGQQTRSSTCVPSQGTRAQLFVCKDAAGKTVPDSSCTSAKPTTSIPCNGVCMGQPPVSTQTCEIKKCTQTSAEVTFTDNANAPSLAASHVSGAPKAKSILQREADAKATVTLKASSVANAKFYKTQILSDGKSSSVSAAAAFDSSKNIAIRLSTGLKWHQVRLKFYDASGKELSRWTSEQFGVGEIFLTAGQSNAGNFAKPKTKSSQAMNRAFSSDSNQWVDLADPLPGANGTGGSPWPRFADLLSAELGVPVGIAASAWGGSSIEQWLTNNAAGVSVPGGKALSERLIKVADQQLQCRFRSVLWHQGETDSIEGTSSKNYVTKLTRLKSLVGKSQLCATRPWVVARASFLPTPNNVPFNRMVAIRNAQTTSWSSGFVRGPDTDLMVGTKYRHDQIHMSSVGLELHSKLWSQYARQVVGLKVQQGEKDLITEAGQVYNLYRQILSRTAADMETDHEGWFYHTRRLQTGEASLAQISKDFSDSDEAFIRSVYVQYRKRQPTLAEVLSLLGSSRDVILKKIKN